MLVVKRRLPRPLPARRILLATLVLLASGSATVARAETAARPEPQSLIAGALPSRSHGVKNPNRLTDGLYGNEGDEWLTDVTSRFLSAQSFVEYDLGSARTIRCALTQADNNDVYILSGSQDGETWQPLWRVGAEPNPGMRLRNQKLEASARYVRLSATGGDALYSVGEIALYGECPSIWPPELVRTRGVAVADTVITKVVIFGIFAAFFLLVHRRKAGRIHYILILPALAAGWMLAGELARLYPFVDQEPSLRALLAVLVGLLALKEAFFKQDSAPHRKVVLGTLAFCAVAAFATYWHFGTLQFFDDAKGRNTLVHTAAMHDDFPTAKYFRELRFDGLNVASLAAYSDNTPGFTTDRLASVRVRDLRDNQMRLGSELKDEMLKVRERFSPERWQEFKRDMKYFSDTMGEADFLASLQDHGSDATLAWLVPAHLLFSHLSASEATLTATALIDPLLILLLFFVIARTFGLRVMLYLAVLWGTSDFSVFGTNLLGATLRQDWLVALGLGVCALKSGRPVWGGVLLAYAALVRVFPSEAALFLAVPIVWFAVEQWREHRRLPRLAEVRVAQRPAVRALGGVVVSVLVALLLSLVLFGAKDTWGAWQQKTEILESGPSANNLGIRNVISFSAEYSAAGLSRKNAFDLWPEWERLQRATFSARQPLYYLAFLLAAALALIACRGRSLEQVCLIGLLLVPFYSYPPNLYLHFVFLLPLIAVVAGTDGERDRNFAAAVVLLALLAVSQAFTAAEQWNDLRYTDQSILLLIAFGMMLIYLARQSWRAAPLWKRYEPESEAEG
ncbi:MAG TPA: discoidin domain-containing protein [Polyangia bacterium]|nr:discoidin domain-containing protein [Polyangia bacterium]